MFLRLDFTYVSPRNLHNEYRIFYFQRLQDYAKIVTNYGCPWFYENMSTVNWRISRYLLINLANYKEINRLPISMKVDIWLCSQEPCSHFKFLIWTVKTRVSISLMGGTGLTNLDLVNRDMDNIRLSQRQYGPYKVVISHMGKGCFWRQGTRKLAVHDVQVV